MRNPEYDIILEIMAEVEHDQWWRNADRMTREENLSPARLERWRQYAVPYRTLSEIAKEIDRQHAIEQIQALRKAGFVIMREAPLQKAEEPLSPDRLQGMPI